MMTHWLLAGGLMGVAVVVFLLGWNASIYWAEWQDDKQLRAAEARHARHARLARVVEAATLPGESGVTISGNTFGNAAGSGIYIGEPPWHFAGESAQGWASESAEYELLTQTAEQPEEQPPPDEIPGQMTLPFPEIVPGVDSPSDFEQSMTDRVNEMIAAWAEQGNYDRHTMHEVG